MVIEVLRWSAATALALIAIASIASNYLLVVNYWRTGRGGSLIPVLGGATGALALIIVPLANLSWLWWMPLLVDVGCAPMIGCALLRCIRQSPERSH